MFSKIDDKTKRMAYMSAVTQEHQEDAQRQTSSVLHQNKTVKPVKVEPAKRVELSGKEAESLAKKELQISSKRDKRAIIGSHLANMKYYDNWRERVTDEILAQETHETSAPQVAKKDTITEPVELIKRQNEEKIQNKFPPVKSYELGGSDFEERKSSKSILDKTMPSSTKDSSTDETDSLFDRLFKNLEKEERDNGVKSNETSETETFDDYDYLSDYTETAEEVQKTEIKPIQEVPVKKAPVAVVPKMDEKPKTEKKKYNKKKKLDADIIGASGFFTIR